MTKKSLNHGNYKENRKYIGLKKVRDFLNNLPKNIGNFNNLFSEIKKRFKEIGIDTNFFYVKKDKEGNKILEDYFNREISEYTGLIGNLDFNKLIVVNPNFLSIKLLLDNGEEIFIEFKINDNISCYQRNIAKGLYLNSESLISRFKDQTNIIISGYYDSLTGLYERDILNSIDSNNYDVIFIDIDDFKSFNDTVGHDFGDSILKYVSDGIKKSIRNGDFAIRWSGDEFVILLKKSDNGFNLVQKIINRLKERINPQDISLGIGYYNGDENLSLKEKIDFADQDMISKKDHTGKLNRLLNSITEREILPIIKKIFEIIGDKEISNDAIINLESALVNELFLLVNLLKERLTNK